MSDGFRQRIARSGDTGGGSSASASMGFDSTMLMKEVSGMSAEDPMERIETALDAIKAIKSGNIKKENSIEVGKKLNIIHADAQMPWKEAFDTIVKFHKENGSQIDQLVAFAEERKAKNKNSKSSGRPRAKTAAELKAQQAERRAKLSSQPSPMLMSPVKTAGGQGEAGFGGNAYTPESPTGNHAQPLDGTVTDEEIPEKRHQKPEHGKSQSLAGAPNGASDYENDSGHFGKDPHSEHQAAKQDNEPIESKVMRLRDELRKAEHNLHRSAILDQLDSIDLEPEVARKISAFLDEIVQNDSPDPIIEVDNISESDVSSYLKDRTLDESTS